MTFRCAALGFWVALASVGCGAARPADPNQGHAGVVFPAHFAEGNNPKALPARAQAPAASGSAHPASAPPSSLPDPEPLRQTEQLEYEIAVDQGKVSVSTVRAVTYPQPVVTARRMGRYAIELWIGRELVDRVRFDVPLGAADDPPAHGPRPLQAPPSFGAGVQASVKVLVPQAARARRAVLVDRATGETTDLTWPPDWRTSSPSCEACGKHAM